MSVCLSGISEKSRSALVLFLILSGAAIPARTYTVRSGDTLFGLSRKFNVSYTELARWNNLDPDSGLRKGQRLKVRDTSPDAPSRPDFAKTPVVTSTGRQSDQASASVGYAFRNPAGKARLVRRFHPWGDDRHYGHSYRSSGSIRVQASAPGRVIRISELRGYGRYVLVDHGQGWVSMYSGLANINVSRGDQVTPESVIGSAKSEMFFLLSRKGKPVDPIVYLEG